LSDREKCVASLPCAQVAAQGISWVEPYLDKMGIQASTVKLVSWRQRGEGGGSIHVEACQELPL